MSVPRLDHNIIPMHRRVCVHLGEQYNEEVLRENSLERVSVRGTHKSPSQMDKLRGLVVRLNTK